MAYFGISAKLEEQRSIGIIGGADGPTAIFVAGKLGDTKVTINETEVVETETAEPAITETTVEMSSLAVEDIVLTEEELDNKVIEIIMEHNKPMFTGEECKAEGHIILEHETEEGVTTVYTLMMYGEYQFQNVDYLIKAAGTGVIPVVLSFGVDEKGQEFMTTRWPDDGSGYNESIKEMFPEHLWERTLTIHDEDRAVLEEMERAYAEEYLKMAGRDAVIGDYADVARTYLTDYGVSHL